MRHDKRAHGAARRDAGGVAHPVSKCHQRLRHLARIVFAAGKAFTKFLFRGFQIRLAFLWVADASVPNGPQFQADRCERNDGRWIRGA